MDAVEQSTTITMFNGREVEFSTIPLSVKETWDLHLELADVAAGPIGSLVSRVLLGGDSPLDVDLGGVGDALEKLPGRMIKAGGFDLVARFLKHTSAKLRTTEGKRRTVALGRGNEEECSMVLTKILGTGNFFKIYEIIKWVLVVNYAPFGMDGSPDWSKLLDALPMLQRMDENNPLKSETPNSPTSG